MPITGGKEGLDVVRILEASNASLRLNGAAVPFDPAGASMPAKNLKGDAALFARG
jgi:hypothetical protein